MDRPRELPGVDYAREDSGRRQRNALDTDRGGEASAARIPAFLERGKEQGFVRPEIDSEMVTGLMLDRILNQVQFAPWIERNYGIDFLTDVAHRRSVANVDVILHALVG